MSIITFFESDLKKIEHGIQDFFHKHGEQYILDHAKTAVAHINDFLKKELAALEQSAQHWLPAIQAFVAKYAGSVSLDKITAFISGLTPYLAGAVPKFTALYHEVATFVTSLLAGKGGEISHVIDTAVQWAYELLATALPAAAL